MFRVLRMRDIMGTEPSPSASFIATSMNNICYCTSNEQQWFSTAFTIDTIDWSWRAVAAVALVNRLSWPSLYRIWIPYHVSRDASLVTLVAYISDQPLGSGALSPGNNDNTQKCLLYPSIAYTEAFHGACLPVVQRHVFWCRLEKQHHLLVHRF